MMSARVLLLGVAVAILFAAIPGNAQITARAVSDDAGTVEPAAGIVAIAAQKSSAPVRIPRFEMGVQTTMLRTPGSTQTLVAVGPAGTLNLNRNFALDAVASFFPGTMSPGEYYGGRLSEALAGVKASIHGAKWTFFAKARPGVVTWSNTLRQLDVTAWPPQSTQDVRVRFGRATSFAMDVGGGVEYRPAPSIAVRAEIGETFMRQAPTRYNGTPFDGSSTHFDHTLQTSTGIYYRFGGTAATEMLSRESGTHPFFDRTNLVLMTVSMLAQASDAITTQRALSDCRKVFKATNSPLALCAQVETNPIARPFVSRGWAGQITLGALVNSAQGLLMYSIHRMGHHKIERFVSVPLTFASGALAYDNLQPK